MVATSNPRSPEQSVKLETVAEKTGQPWSHWVAVLDAFDAVTRGHTAAAKHLRDDHDVGAWWAQTLTVRYEQAKGLRDIGERRDGFEVTVSRTITATAEDAFDAITNPARLAQWFTSAADADVRVGGRYRTADKDEGEFLALDPPHRVKLTWDNPDHGPGTLAEFDISSKDEDRIVVRVTHSRLADAAARDEMRQGWRWAMDSLRSYLETGRGLPSAEGA